jgi:hypothetical protein
VVEDACRGIDVEGSIAKTRDLFNRIGVRCATSGAIKHQPAA